MRQFTTTLKKSVDNTNIVVVSTKEKAVRDFSSLAEYAQFEPSSHNLVLVKPNVCGMYPPALKLLESVIRYIKPYSQTVIIGETPSAMRSPAPRFKTLGITRLCNQLGLIARDLMRDDVVVKMVPQPHAMKQIPFPSTVFQADLLVNCPGLGTHGNTLLTCALKNLFGLIAERHKFSKLHPKGVSEVVADVYQLIKPQLTVVDCGKQVLVGTDALSIDVVACDYLSLSPFKVKHLILAARDLGFELKDLDIQRIQM